MVGSGVKSVIFGAPSGPVATRRCGSSAAIPIPGPPQPVRRDRTARPASGPSPATRTPRAAPGAEPAGKLARLALALAPAVAAAGIAAAPARAQETDPFEPANRGVFWVNDRLDDLALEPAARGWDRITPGPVRRSIRNFFVNLRFPVRLVGNLFQGELSGTGHEVARFTVNTTVGIAGLFDPASELGLELHDEDFGQVLGRWGVPPGPYLVLPLLGPSNPRDTVGLVVDAALSSGLALASPEAAVAARGVELLNTRALAIDEVREAKEASLDYYALVRSAYIQQRRSQIENGALATEELEDDLYELDDE